MDQKKTYSTNEAAKILKTADRTVRRYLNSYYSSEGNGFKISEKMMKLLELEICGQGADNLRTDSGQSADRVSADVAVGDIEVEYDVVEGFSAEEYQEFQKRLIEYPLLKDQIAALEEQIQYHRKQVEYHIGSTESTRMQMQTLLEGFRERNFIEAKEKGFDDNDFIKP